MDIVNDGFVKLFSHFHKFQLAENGEDERLLMGWLKKILINASIDELRKGNMMPEIGGIPQHAWSIPGGPEADQLILYKELIILVKELPPGYRAVFNLYAIDGYSHHEIAALLGISAGTSKSNLSKARALLQRKVKTMEESKLCQI
jgi:RNA polymerase sigma-70 factor (ECF subfamily)